MTSPFVDRVRSPYLAGKRRLGHAADKVPHQFAA